MPPKICLVLTENTIEKNTALIEKYRNWIDAAELRADFLLPEELLHIRSFPRMVDIPVILTVRRLQDGGVYDSGEGSRIILLAHGLAFSDTDSSNNFAYIDLESDIHIPCLEEAAQAYNIGIIRSVHYMHGPVRDIAKIAKDIRRTEAEIVKIAYKAETLSDVTVLFEQAPHCTQPHTVIAMGSYGMPSRILASRLDSAFVYTMPESYIKQHGLEQEYIDPITLNTLYRFRKIDSHTKIYGVAGADTSKSLSPAIHNAGFGQKEINAVYIPLSASNIEQIIDFSVTAGLSGFSITHPFKFDIIPFLDTVSPKARACGAVNTVVCAGGKRQGFNTDIYGITRALQEFLCTQTLRFKRVSIIGTGGAAYAAAQAVHTLGGKACIFGRNIEKAKTLAQKYGFIWAVLDSSSLRLLKKYASIIIQATSIGMQPHEDPLEFYSFSGNEYVFDVIYTPEQTPLLHRAEQAGCKTSNGYMMLRYQAYKQFELFTGEQYE
ncbi:MAG: type I 3-dehydroquinate dehydratase [Treponema sp.]